MLRQQGLVSCLRTGRHPFESLASQSGVVLRDAFFESEFRGMETLDFPAVPFDVSGYEYLTSVSAYPARDKGIAIGDSLVLRIAPDSSVIRIMRDSAVVLTVTIDSAIVRASRDSVPSPIVVGTVQVGPKGPSERPPLVIDAENSGVRVRLFLTSLSAIRRDGVWRIQYFHGNLLLSTGAGLSRP